MIEENFDIIYKAFRIALYRRVFAALGQREGSLSAMDYFSVETIYLLGNPTITEFANTLCISQPNATYRVKSLVEKGYVVKTETEKKNTYRLQVTDKFMRFYHEDMDYGHFIFKRLSERFSAEELEQVDGIFKSFIAQIKEEGKTC
ncbi:MAG: MarR family transcriptional regulator [Clostridiales bacterium]|nr:MarR family transcriptional regulator [Clostridiales bacterium]